MCIHYFCEIKPVPLKKSVLVHFTFIFSLIFVSGISEAQTISNQYTERILITHNDSINGAFVYDSLLHVEQWDTLAQASFWKTVMSLSPDSAVLNVAATREVLNIIPSRLWRSKSDSWKQTYKDSVRSKGGMAMDTKLYVTSGRSHFYRIDKTLSNINGALPVFDSMGVDPWYAQTILLIESPNSTTTSSSVGAHGPFQLMKSVATKRGLKVTSKIDEREDLVKSAGAACKLIKLICIPETKRMLDRHNVTYTGNELWFRLLVMHSYHAGAGNVGGAIDIISPDTGGVHIITELWHTEYRGFKNASQNYSQVALAALLRFDEYLSVSDTFYILEGDRLFADYGKVPARHPNALSTMDSCIQFYEGDLLENRTPFVSFIARVRTVEHQKQMIIDSMDTAGVTSFKVFPSGQKHLNRVGYKLLRRRRFVDAIAAFQLNVDNNPESWNAHDSLGEAYMKSGDKTKAIEHYEKSVKLNPKNSSGKTKLAKLKAG